MAKTEGAGGPAHSDPVHTDEDIRNVTVGDVREHNDVIRIDDYDEGWPRLFDREAERVRSAVGTAALRIEHVGSTAVPGLPAKPIVDMVLVVSDSADEASYVSALETVGYVLRIREPDWLEHRLFKGPDTDINLHVFSEGEPEVDRMLRFRDRLRSCDADRDDYARIKRDLANRVWRHVQNYADAKTAIVGEILARTPGSR